MEEVCSHKILWTNFRVAQNFSWHNMLECVYNLDVLCASVPGIWMNTLLNLFQVIFLNFLTVSFFIVLLAKGSKRKKYFYKFE